MAKLPGWHKETSPFHDGERALQNRLGLAERQEEIGQRIMRPFMPDQHRDFFAQLPFMIIASLDAKGWPWASILFGPIGFVQTPNDRQMHIQAQPLSGDPLAGNITAEKPVSLLGIELPTRRRNRMNGVMTEHAGDGLLIDVVQSFGNCPKYIQTRDMSFTREPSDPVDIKMIAFDKLTDELRSFIAKTDTFFVASYNPKDDIRDTGGMDVNHRGGKPGFIHIKDNTLTIPDYAGNNLFNSLGNFLMNPKAGLLFIDFETGDIIQMVGHAEVLWEMTPEIAAMPNAKRAWTFKVDHGHILKAACPLRWEFGEYSSYL